MNNHQREIVFEFQPEIPLSTLLKSRYAEEWKKMLKTYNVYRVETVMVDSLTTESGNSIYSVLNDIMIKNSQFERYKYGLIFQRMFISKLIILETDVPTIRLFLAMQR